MNPLFNKIEDNGEVYELYALRYATTRNRSAKQNFLITHDIHDTPMPMDFYVWFAVCGERVIMIDGGAHETTVRARGHEFLRCPAQAMTELGFRPESVTDLIVSHMHWDHMGNVDKFPNARLHIHKTEMAFATGCDMCQPLLQRPYDVEQVCQVVRALYGGRVNFNEGECAIAPGIGAHHVGGHAPGLQVVTVRTRRGVVVLASDALHFYENLTRDNPFSVVVDVPDYLRAFGTLARLAASPEHIVPGHDPLVLRLYPPASDAWAGEAVRLDAVPSQPTPLAGLRGGFKMPEQIVEEYSSRSCRQRV